MNSTKMQIMITEMQKNRSEKSSYITATKYYKIEVTAGTVRLSIPP